MVQLNLSKILPEFHRFSEESGQLFIDKGAGPEWFDMLYITTKDKLHLFLYVLNKYAYSRRLFIGYERIHIVDDTTSSEDSDKQAIFTVEDYYMIESSLVDYNITTSHYSDIVAARRLGILSLEEFERYASATNGLAGYGSSISEQLSISVTSLDDMIPTEVFIDCNNNESSSSYITTCKALTSHGFIYEYLNSSYASYKQEVILQEPSNVKGSKVTIDGWTEINETYIWWIICHLPNTECPYSYLSSLYNYICNQDAENIFVSSKGLSKDGNNRAKQQITFKPSQTYTIPNSVLYLLALVHVNTGKVIEFIGFSQHLQTIYLNAVEEYTFRHMCEFKERVEAFSRVETGGLYLTPIYSTYYPVQVKSKNMNLRFRVVNLESVLSRVELVNGEYVIRPSINDSLPFEEWSEKDMDISQVELKSFIDTTLQLLDFQQESKDTFRSNVKLVESFTYAVLRMLEQKFFQFQKAKTMADILLFEYNSQFYIGFGAMKPEYDTRLFLCSQDISSVDYTAHTITPASVIIREEPQPIAFTKLTNICKLTKPQSFDAANIEPLVLALAQTKVLGYPFEYGDVFSLQNVSNIEAFTKASLYRAFNFTVRKELWNELTQQFTSFGLRTLNYETAPLTIYGGLNVSIKDRATIAIYPVAFDKYPRRAMNDL